MYKDDCHILNSNDSITEILDITDRMDITRIDQSPKVIFIIGTIKS